MEISAVLLFGDQLDDKLPAIKHLYSLSRKRPLLKIFLQEATEVVQHQLSLLTLQERGEYGHFNDLLELAEWHAGLEHPSELLGAPLGTAAQIGELLTLAEDDPSILCDSNENVNSLGICLGLLAASVAVASRDTGEIVRLGVEVVGLTVRLGLALTRRGRSIEASPGSWAVSVIGLDLEDIEQRLAHFNENLPQLRHAYPGVIASSWITLFAPPSTIELIEKSPEFRDVPQTRLASACPVHASKLPCLDVEHVIGQKAVLDKPLRGRSLLSSSTCKPYQASTLRELLRKIVEDIAQNPLRLERTVNHLASTFNKNHEVNLIPIGATLHTPGVKQILDQQKLNVSVKKSHDIQSNDCERHLSHDSGSVAIVGMSGRFPGAETLEDFWELLEAGLDMHKEIPASRFNLNDYYDSSEDGQNTVKTRFGCFLDNPGLFDHGLFKVSPKEAMQMDPIQRMLLMTTYEALQQAGYAPNASNSSNTSRIATYFGQSSMDWMNINDQEGIGTYYISGTNRAFTPGRLNHYFNWGGGSYNIDTACSSSSTSVHLACKALLSRECDMGVVGGGNVCSIPEQFAGLSRGSFLSPTGGCKSFSDDADGYCRGEAVGVVVLKRLEDALRDNDKVLAVIRGTARNSNAGSASSIAFPNEEAQIALFRQLLRQTNVDPRQIGYIEMHSPGTQAGDAAEMATVMETFARSRTKANPLYVGSVKANVGHSEAAAGIVALMKGILVLQKRYIPPQPGYPFTLNRNFGSLHEANIAIADRPTLWRDRDDDDTRKILINGFDASGGNTSIILEEAAQPRTSVTDPRTHHVVVCSGRTQTALHGNKAKLLAFLAKHQHELPLGDLAYSTTARRIHEPYRESYVVQSTDELMSDLKISGSSKWSTPVHTLNTSLVFAFTGQSAQYTGMGSSLYKTSPYFKNLLDSYQTLADSQGLDNFIGIIRGSQAIESASVSQSQMAIVALEVALARYWQSLGLQPDIVLGHSLGEYAALCAAGVLSIGDTLYLVHHRAAMMNHYCGGAHEWAMLATGLPHDEANLLISACGCVTCNIACLNGPSSTVISGSSEELKVLKAELDQKKVASSRLSVPFGFHSRQMDPILDKFQDLASGVHYNSPTIPVVSTMTGEVVRSAGVFNACYLRRQTREPVDFTKAVQACESEHLITNSSVMFEIGPNPVCINLIQQSLQQESPRCFSSLQQGVDSWLTISRCLGGAYNAGLPLHWSEFHHDFQQCVQVIDLPRYAFDLKNFWTPYLTPAVANANTMAHPTPDALIPIFSTTCLQRVEAFESHEASLTARFSSRTADPNLFKALQGHVVNGIGICPASIFADMAYTAAKFLLAESKAADAELEHMQIWNLNMTHALVIDYKNAKQVIHVHAELDQNAGGITVRFSSSNGSSAEEDHGTCELVMDNDVAARQTEWKKMQRLVNSRVEGIFAAPKSHRMTTPLFYKLFADVVAYHQPYQLLEEAYIDESFDDAVASIDLKHDTELGIFTHNPYTMDAVVHLAGFLLNADLERPQEEIHIASSIGTLSIIGSLTDERRCTVYASVRERGDDCSICDVYVFDDTELIAECTDIQFQRLSRDVFSALVTTLDSVEPGSSSETRADADRKATSKQERTTASQRSQQLSQLLLKRLGEELGTEPDDLDDDTELSELGMNSMMSIKVLSSFKKQSGVELPVGFFVSNPTVAEVKEALDSASDGEAPSGSRSKRRNTISNLQLDTRSSSSSTPHQGSTPTQGSSTSTSPPSRSPGVTQQAPAPFEIKAAQPEGKSLSRIGDLERSLSKPNGIPEMSSVSNLTSRAILIQGKSRSTDPPLFLAPAGIGMVAPYIYLPPLPNGRRIYALESPFIEQPEHHNLTIEEMASVLVSSIRRIQAKGPYILGGYSAGGALAYEMARQLAETGDEIAGLLIIDMYVPQPVPSAESITVQALDRSSVFAGINRGVSLLEGLTEKQKQHMTATVRALAKYDPKAFAYDCMPGKAAIVWATKGLNESADFKEHDNTVTKAAAMGPVGEGKQSSQEMTKEEFESDLKSWFLGKRYSFGTNGWEAFVGSNIKVHKVEADHYSIMERSNMEALGSIVVPFVDNLTGSKRDSKQLP